MAAKKWYCKKYRAVDSYSWEGKEKGREAAVDGAEQIDVLNTHVMGNTGCMIGLFKPGKVTSFSSHCARKKENFYHPHNKLNAFSSFVNYKRA